MSDPLTFMAVHAHPDDEVMSTGGVLARYADEGLRTVVVTCTNGELGDLPGGIKPDADDHDQELVVRTRLAELERSCAVLGVTHLELLGYRDSGMADWDHKGHPDAFCNIAVDEAADRLAKIVEQYRPDVVVTYDTEAGYNHPDHIQTSRVTTAALEATGQPAKFYFTASRADRFARIREILTEHGVELPSRPPPSEEWMKRARAQEARITTTIDIGAFAQRKLEALRAHASQVQDSFWGKLPTEALVEIFGREFFVRVRDRNDGPLPEDDLFAGMR